jgi:hypothetical protein
MPPRRKRAVPKSRAATRAELEGEGIMDVVRGLNRIIKKNKVISRSAGVLDFMGVPHASKVKFGANLMGYGHGGALHPGGSRGPSHGGSLRPGGSRGPSRGACRGRGKPKPKKKVQKKRKTKKTKKCRC